MCKIQIFFIFALLFKTMSKKNIFICLCVILVACAKNANDEYTWNFSDLSSEMILGENIAVHSNTRFGYMFAPEARLETPQQMTMITNITVCIWQLI